MSAQVAIASTLIGCAVNFFFLEYLVSKAPGCGPLITFIQFLFIAIEGFAFHLNFGQNKVVIPIRTYVFMVIQFFVVSCMNNYALNFNIPMPLHLIFRSGSLIANLLLGVLILKKRYTTTKYLSVLLITIGIAMATIVSSSNVSAKGDSNVQQETLKWIIGISLLTCALFLSALMGIYQETVYSKHGKHPSEALFFNHALPLPLFSLFYSNIVENVQIFNDSEPIILPILEIPIPSLWLYTIGNTLTVFICIKSVFILTTEVTSLTVTLIVTLRKFVSLVVSIVYFGNTFGGLHWLATSFVFFGTLMFTGVIDLGSLMGGGGSTPDAGALKHKPSAGTPARGPLVEPTILEGNLTTSTTPATTSSQVRQRVVNKDK